MQLITSVHGTEALLTVSGHVDDVDVPALRTRVLRLLDQNGGDVLLDMRRVDRVDDLLIPALAVVRSRAKYLRHRVVVIDRPDGVTILSLRRHGMEYRFPVYPDQAGASAGLAQDRAALDRLTVGGPVRTPPPAPETETETETETQPAGDVQSGQVLWAVRDGAPVQPVAPATPRAPAMTMAPATPSGRPARRLRLRGGVLDGSTWQAEIDIGHRICCGPGPWSPSHVYVVTSEVAGDPGGPQESVAVPARF